MMRVGEESYGSNEQDITILDRRYDQYDNILSKSVNGEKNIYTDNSMNRFVEGFDMNINELELHDEKIINIEMKSQKDYFDCIYIRIECSDKTLTIKCLDCFSATINCNMGIIGKDSIRDIEISDITIEKTISLYPEKKTISNYKRLYINTNTTNSVIEIVAKDICYSLE